MADFLTVIDFWGALRNKPLASFFDSVFNKIIAVKILALDCDKKFPRAYRPGVYRKTFYNSTLIVCAEFSPLP